MQNWQEEKLRGLLTLSTLNEKPQPGKKYRLAGTRMWGEGCYERETIDGADTAYQSFTLLEEGDLVYNKIWVRHGAIGVIQQELAGCYVTSEFPVYKIDRAQVEPTWIKWVVKRKSFWELCDEKAHGSSGKSRIRPERFLNLAIKFPVTTDQQRIVSRIEQVRHTVSEIKRLRAEQQAETRLLLRQQFRQAIAGAAREPLGRVAPLVRRPVLVDEEVTYKELGIRSFGKGTFHKPGLPGLEVGTKKLFHIHPGDLLFSNVFAWEGAIAVAKATDAGRVGSHRFISCLCDGNKILPAFLCYYFLTPEGLVHINKASPGGAGRNKTLGLGKLECIEVPVPPIPAQRKFLALQARLTQLTNAQQAAQHELDLLLPATLDRAFRGEL